MSDPIIVENETTLVIQEQAIQTLVISAPGPQGIQGTQGDPGPGVPAGGTAAQILAKASGSDFDTEWVDPLTAGSDYEVPLSFNAPLSRSSNSISFQFSTNNIWTGNNTFNNKLTIPIGSNPTLDTAGQVALDTTNNQLLSHNGSAVQVQSVALKSFTFTLTAPTTSDTLSMVRIPYNVTLTKIRGTILGGTSLVFTVEKRASASLNSSGTQMPNSTITASNAGSETTSFSVATASAGDHLVFVPSTVSGAPSQVEIYVEFTIDRT